MFTGRRAAELIKYAANAFLATKITFINEIADLAEKVGADVQDIARGIGLDNRIGSKFLHAGPGFGGSCFPKDTLAFLKTGQDNDSPLRMVEAVVAVNDARKRAMARKVSAALGGELRGKTVAVLGLTFKPNTDDMREAPSIPLITALQDMGAIVRAYDPEGMDQAKRAFPRCRPSAATPTPARKVRRARHRYRMGAVSGARFRAARQGDGAPGVDRSAQHLSAGRGHAPRLFVRGRGTGKENIIRHSGARPTGPAEGRPDGKLRPRTQNPDTNVMPASGFRTRRYRAIPE